MATPPYKIQVPAEEFDEKKPPEKVFYQVLLKYNAEAEENSDIPKSAISMESQPCETTEEAHKVLNAVIEDIMERIKDVEIAKIPPKDQIDNYNLLIIRKRESKEDKVFILARLGIVRIDYSQESIH